MIGGDDGSADVDCGLEWVTRRCTETSVLGQGQVVLWDLVASGCSLLPIASSLKRCRLPC